MAKIIGFRREPFDRKRDFCVGKPMRFRGTDLAPGTPFDKTQVSLRRLRQLYDSRYLVFANKKQSDSPPPLDLSKLSDRQIALLLEDNGIKPRYGAGREWLIKRAEKFLAQAA